MLSKLPLLPNISTESKIASYYGNNAVSKDLNFQLLETSPEKILSILKGLNPSKTAGIDNLSGKFLKDGAHFLARPISQLCNLSIKLNSFPRSWKIAKVNHFLKKALTPVVKTTVLFHSSSSCYQILLKGLFITKQRIFWVRTNFSTGVSQVFEKTTLQTFALIISLIKLLPDSEKTFLLEWF